MWARVQSHRQQRDPTRAHPPPRFVPQADLLLGRMVTTGGSADIPDRFLRAVRYALARLSHRGSPTALR
jgi:hypothetical protein